MPPVEERDSPSADPSSGVVTEGAADQTPSVIRPLETKSTPPTSDTLLSASQLTRGDLELNERLLQCERGIGELMLRVERLERRPTESHPEPSRLRWLWLVFLAALALAWQILARL
jgi:hypothetical protein